MKLYFYCPKNTIKNSSSQNAVFIYITKIFKYFSKLLFFIGGNVWLNEKLLYKSYIFVIKYSELKAESLASLERVKNREKA